MLRMIWNENWLLGMQNNKPTLFNISIKVIDNHFVPGSDFSRINYDCDHEWLDVYSINLQKIKISHCHFQPYRFSSICMFLLFSLIAASLEPEMQIGSELESTIWWHLVIMFPWKTSDLQFLDRSLCIYSWQLYGNLRGKPCIHEYCSSITMQHLKFIFLHCEHVVPVFFN